MNSMRRVPCATAEGAGAWAALLEITSEAPMASSKVYKAQEGIPLRLCSYLEASCRARN